MPKMIVVESCIWCPYYVTGTYISTEMIVAQTILPICNKAGRSPDSFDTIPSWCPLPDAPDVETLSKAVLLLDEHGFINNYDDENQAQFEHYRDIAIKTAMKLTPPDNPAN